ncbi:SiaB family protein kinase [Sediminitomix flava]|uniref:Uncharacterized protein n=1 Tax=Sediminitomix flava TaxID=379075 RepID=A0A315ZGQ9_SEDFL|nr:SiaB family protein kinase [Sediminitomix flava]PWJ44701.1 hypothetical protein BC781_1011072 [Sediminitomix flava]
MQLEETQREFFSLKTFKEQLGAHRLSLSFQGMFSQDVLSLIGHTLKNAPDSRILSKRLFGLVVEMAQNIHHYSAEKVFSEKEQRDIGIGVVAIGESEEHHIICSGNYVENNVVEPMIERANYINQLSPEELKQFYKEQRRAPQRKNKPGANLGFIEMVRKSVNPIDVRVEQVDDKLSFFTLTVRVNKNI